MGGPNVRNPRYRGSLLGAFPRGNGVGLGERSHVGTLLAEIVFPRGNVFPWRSFGILACWFHCNGGQ